MRKFMMGACLSALLLGACSKAPGYKVSGTVANAEEGDTVTLSVLDGWNLVPLEKTVIKDGKFTFEGRQDTAVVRILSCNSKKGESRGLIQFFLENGNIEVEMDTTFVYHVKGTKANEDFCDFENRNEQLSSEAMKIYYTLQDSTLDETKRAELEESSQKKDQEIRNFIKQFCKAHISEVSGAYALALHVKDFEEQEMMELVNQMPEGSLIPEINDLKAEYQNKQKTAIGQPFVDFTMKTPAGEDLSVSDVAKQAKVLMIDFWASWCGPCRAEMPAVKEAYAKYHDKGFEIIGVSLDANEADWKKAIEQLELPWPQMSDLKGWECAGADLYGVKAIPATVLIKEGVIINRNLRGEAIQEALAQLLD